MKLLSILAIALTLGMSSASADLTTDNLPFIRTAGADLKVVYFLLESAPVTPEAICADRTLNAGGVILYTPKGHTRNVLCAE